jgi:hypothetical protein
MRFTVKLHEAFEALAGELVRRKLLGPGCPIATMHLHGHEPRGVSLEPAPEASGDQVEAVKVLAGQWEWPTPTKVWVSQKS